MTKRLRISCLALLVMALVILILCSIPSLSLRMLLFGPRDQELGIRTFRIKSFYQRYQNTVQVLLPDRYDPMQAYPVLYILPPNVGLWDGLIINGIREAARNDLHNKHQVICVYPSYERMPWYGDHPTDPRMRQESHLINAVVPFVDNTFSTVRSREGRMLVGYSKSGWAAYAMLLRHPQLFGKAASFDAPLLFNDIYQWGTGLEEVFGDEQNFDGYDLAVLMKQKARLFQERDPEFVLMGYAFIKEQTEAMHDYFIRSRVPHVYDLRQWSGHSWNSGWLPLAVSYLMEGAKARGADAELGDGVKKLRGQNSASPQDLRASR